MAFFPYKTFAHALFRLFYARGDFFLLFFFLTLAAMPFVVVVAGAVDCHHLVSPRLHIV